MPWECHLKKNFFNLCETNIYEHFRALAGKNGHYLPVISGGV